ncbi:hypothetical protein [Curtobacterium sp. MCPF17_052]|uniref:hypothetical protein n=1 Tax=Curtobacterium sp. MCPF17_052 TaxID=2175655 RepID=UPI0024DF90A3|nr:hypothetical protein [Curtobacterium sp. MCPF17_052]WIB12481.1 hypothetical protein DEJ36_17900 [Curtobacterium sp. MCPF17_052]
MIASVDSDTATARSDSTAITAPVAAGTAPSTGPAITATTIAAATLPTTVTTMRTRSRARAARAFMTCARMNAASVVPNTR